MQMNKLHGCQLVINNYFVFLSEQTGCNEISCNLLLRLVIWTVLIAAHRCKTCEPAVMYTVLFAAVPVLTILGLLAVTPFEFQQDL